jgi:CheY-like chemotaxis protein
MAVILIVDDESAIAETLSEVLQWKGHDVMTAANGQIALERMRERIPSVVLLDYMMPVLDGIQTLKTIRAEPALANVPVILMSAAPENSIPRTERWNAFLRKPFREPALVAALASFLDP